MLDPDELWELEPDVEVPGDLVLVQALDGFVDAAGAVRRAREHLLAGDPPAPVVATFDVDLLLDYRSRRPALLFDRDKWISYDQPELAVRLVDDQAGTPFLLLTGPEPDLHWDRFTEAVAQLVEQLGVRLTIGVDAIPLAVPHTRPTGVTLHGSRPELLGEHEPWLDQVKVPGSVGHLIEYRLGLRGLDTMGIAVHVPQYLAQTEFPTASVELLDAVAAAADLKLDTEALRVAAEDVRLQIDAQVSRSAELTAMVEQLETQFDTFIAARNRRSVTDEAMRGLPTADELGAELERFLAEQQRENGDPT